MATNNNYLEQERKKIVSRRDSIFNDPGGGLYKNQPREFVLNTPDLNLWDGIRQEAFQYFSQNKIRWWNEKGNGPTGHLLSSQIACLNHLGFLRNQPEIASAILKNRFKQVVGAGIVDDGCVEFEVIGNQNYLGEKSHIRGANSTSIDAVMVGKKSDGNNILFMIEWKFTESYSPKNLYIPARSSIYDRLLFDSACPIKIDQPADVYFEPYYQLMRQTLLGWQMTNNREYGCDEYLHIHIIPEGNKKLRETNTSPRLEGATMTEAWKNILKDSPRYLVISPEDFLEPMQNFNVAKPIFEYLSKRYWT